MKGIALDVESGHLSFGDLDAALIGLGVEFAVLCISRHQHQLVRHWQHEDHSPLFSREYKSWPNRMLLLP
jgi:hypothetical protein